MRQKAALPYEAIFTYVYAVFRINLCLLAAGLPLVLALAVIGSPLAAWPFFAVLSVLCGPAVTAAFAAFAALSDEPERVGRVFWTGYRTGFPRSLAVAGIAAAAAIALGVDLQFAAASPFKAAVPMLALLIALVVAVATAVLAVGRRLSVPSLFVCAYLCVRRWYLNLANLAVLGVLLAAVLTKPALGLAVLPGPALYVMWANTRHIIAPLTSVTDPQKG